MPLLPLAEAQKRLGITPVKGVRTGIVVAANGDANLLVQFKREDDSSTPSYIMSVSGAIDLIASLSEKLDALGDPSKFEAFTTDRAKTNDDHNPPATE